MPELASPSEAKKFGALLPDDFVLGLNKTIEFEAPIRLARKSTYQDGVMIGAYSFAGMVAINSLSSIGRYCSIAKGVTIGARPHPMSWLSTSSFQYHAKKFSFYDKRTEPRVRRTPDNDSSKRKGPVIGHDVWIGANAIILNNVTVGSGSVIAAGAVVAKDVPPYAIVAGVPAQVIKYRFDEETRHTLLDLAWWNYNVADTELPFDRPLEAISEIRDKIASGDLEPFLPPRYALKRRREGFHLSRTS